VKKPGQSVMLLQAENTVMGMNHDMRSFLLLTSMGWTHKATLAPQPFLIYCASSSEILIIPDLSTRALWRLQAEISSSKAGGTWEKWQLNFACKVSLSYS
jgi:hypothetical protein